MPEPLVPYDDSEDYIGEAYKIDNSSETSNELNDRERVSEKYHSKEYTIEIEKKMENIGDSITTLENQVGFSNSIQISNFKDDLSQKTVIRNCTIRIKKGSSPPSNVVFENCIFEFE